VCNSKIILIPTAKVHERISLQRGYQMVGFDGVLIASLTNLHALRLLLQTVLVTDGCRYTPLLGKVQ
jgi:hypothetical protein